MKKAIGRRQFLGTTLALGASTGLPAQESPDEVALSLEDNIYTRLLGVRPHKTFVRGTRERGGSRTSFKTYRD